MDNEDHLNDEEIRLECIRLAVEFAPEIARITDPLDKAQLYYNWVKQNSKRQPEKTASKKDKVKS